MSDRNLLADLGIKDSEGTLQKRGRPSVMNEVLRQEKKYLLNIGCRHALSYRLGRVMMEDKHNGAGG